MNPTTTTYYIEIPVCEGCDWLWNRGPRTPYTIPWALWHYKYRPFDYCAACHRGINRETGMILYTFPVKNAGVQMPEGVLYHRIGDEIRRIRVNR
jgi:hypothetical protein